MKELKHLLQFIFVGFLVSACTVDQNKTSYLTEELQEIKLKFAPDKRVALFNVSADKQGNSYILRGESNMKDAVVAFKDELASKNISYVDSIEVLPSMELKGKTNAVITISVANLRSNPKHSAELATQATLGTPVKVLKKQGGWYYIQTPDNYLSWVDDGGITLFNTAEFYLWKTNPKIIYNNTYGHSYVEPNKTAVVSDLVAGSILQLIKKTADFYHVRYPDGREAYVSKKESEEYDSWLLKLNVSQEALVETSQTLKGVPYLWGGTSTKGMDCSGFTKTIYFLNGMIIPRDASQQVHTGQQVDENQNFQSLQKGDLLFFGRKATDSTKEKVVHVGMWIGNNEFIHASNMVRVSSIDSTAKNYDAYNLNRYLRTKRILKAEDKDLVNLKQVSIY